MRTGRILAAIVLSALVLPGQDAVPRMRMLGGVDNGVGGFMEFADGSMREFHAKLARSGRC